VLRNIIRGASQLGRDKYFVHTIYIYDLSF